MHSIVATLMCCLLLLLPLTAAAQSSGSSSSSSGGSSGSARTESAPSGTMRTGPDRGPANAGGGSATMGGGGSSVLGAPGGGTAPGGGGPLGSAQQSRIPNQCLGSVAAPDCGAANAPTGTGLGDRGTRGGDNRRYGPEQSPVQGGPAFTGPTGLPVNPPHEPGR